MSNEIGLNTRGEADNIALKSLSWDGTVDGLVFTCVATQEYVNTDNKTLEISYTFPISWDAAVVEFAAQIEDKRLVATALPKKEAESKYEKALNDGDLPLLLQCSDASLGLYTANLGNLKPGESVKISITTAQLLLWNRGEVRLNLPTVIAERYSTDGSQAKLLPHEKVRASIFANYQGTAKITVKGFLAKAKISCLNHVASYATQTDSTVLDITNATPDRDIAFIFKDAEPMPVAIRNVPVDEPGNAVEICTFYPLGEHKDKPINLNVVVDCSGSMDGIPISQARNALKNLLENLEEKDTITFTRFGNDFFHDISAPTSVSAMNLRRDIEPLLQKLAADLGGTEMERALSSVFKMATPSSDVLLITDGDIWNADPIIKEATESGHRIFVIGVSSAPAEPLLKQLAQKTNGACTVVMPAEDMKPVLIRMVEKMHTSQFSYELTRGEQKKEVKLWAGQSATFIWNESRPSALPELTCLTNPNEKILSPNRWTPNSSIELYRSLIKIYALRLYRQTEDENKRKEIAEKFGLLSPYVSFVMVNERTDVEKFKGFPDSQITPQMYRGHVLTSPQVFDLEPQKDWESMSLEPGFYGCAQPSSSVSCGILGAAQPQREASPSMLKNPKATRKTTTSRGRTKKKPSPFTAEQEDWIRQRLQMASMYYVFYGNVYEISMLIDDSQGYLLAVDPQRISEEGKIALAFLVLDAYFQKYIRKNDEDKSLSPHVKEKFLSLVPYKETYIKRCCEKLMPENVLIPFLMFQISCLEDELNEEEPDSDPDPE